MRIHMVRSVHGMLWPNWATGFGKEFIACEPQPEVVFGPPRGRFHSSDPADVTCWKCLRLLAEGAVDLTPMSAGEQRDIATEHLQFTTTYALRREVALAGRYIAESA